MSAALAYQVEDAASVSASNDNEPSYLDRHPRKPLRGKPPSGCADDGGNITSLGNLSFLYDKADQPVAVSSGVNASYTYDGNLKRVKSVSNGKTIYNVYDFAGRLAHVDKVTEGKETDYLHGMGQTIARIENNVFTYLHPDHLGSPQAATNRYGNLLWTEHYTPFGEAMINAAANDNHSGFTGHIKDDAIIDNGQNWDAAQTDTLLLGLLQNTPDTCWPTPDARSRFYQQVRRMRRHEKYAGVMDSLQSDGWTLPPLEPDQEI